MCIDNKKESTYLKSDNHNNNVGKIIIIIINYKHEPKICKRT